MIEVKWDLNQTKWRDHRLETVLKRCFQLGLNRIVLLWKYCINWESTDKIIRAFNMLG